jgi:Carboxypeptidase regulatory-like domain
MKGILDNTHANGELSKAVFPMTLRSRSLVRLATLSIFLIFSSLTTLAIQQSRQARSNVSISGRVVDDRKNPVRGVQVQAQGRRPVLTNGKGEFILAHLRPAERLAVNFSAPGFMNTTRVYRATAGAARIGGKSATIVIWPRAAAVTLDATRGGKVTFRNGGGVTLPARSLIDGNGKPVRGQVRVNLTYLDVANQEQIKAAPGDFTARMRNGKVSRLESFGIFEISVNDLRGRPVELIRGKTARLELPIPRERADKAPRTTGLFSFDRVSGSWVEEGRLIREVREVGQLLYTATINQVNVAWNADDLLETTCLIVYVLNPLASEGVEANAIVQVSGVNYSYTATTPGTNADGITCVLVKRCELVTVQAFSTQNPSLVSPVQTVMSSCSVGNMSDCPENLQKNCSVVTLTLN